jgi:hypothetical protein
MSTETNETKPPRAFGLSTMFRAMGAAIFVLAGASFLVEGWTDPGVVSRQAAWAAGTLLMTVCGVLAIRRFRDAIGARVFLGLAAATIPAHFAQVGASVWALTTEKTGTVATVLAASAMLLGLAPPLALGLSALVRRRARLLVALVFVTGLPLILPTRSGDVVALLGLAELLLCLGLEATVFRADAVFGTVEGIAARVLLFLPAVILLLRNCFYVETRAWMAALVGLPSLAALVLPRVWRRAGRLPRGFQLAGAVGLCLAILIGFDDPSLVCLMLGAAALAASEVVPDGRGALGWCATGFLAAAGVVSVFDESAVFILAMVAAGVIHTIAAFRRRSPRRMAAAAGITLISIVARLALLIRFHVLHLWVPAVAISIALLIVASALEHHRDGIRHALSRLEEHFAPKA